MKEITVQNIFNQNTLNIFTDASIIKENGNFTAASGYISIIGKDIVDSDVKHLISATNNIGELVAIKMGVTSAIHLKSMYPNITTINLFSDSKISIFSLREWIFNWVKKVKDRVMYNSSNIPVENQHYILSIIYLILENDLSINFYHLKSHCIISNEKHIYAFKRSFVKENRLSCNISDQLVYEFIKNNSFIDNIVYRSLREDRYLVTNITRLPSLYRYVYYPFDTNKYSNLINQNKGELV